MANTSKKSTNAKTKSTKSTKSTKTAKTRKGTAPATERVTRIKASESSAPRVSVDVPASKKSSKKSDAKPAKLVKSDKNDGVTRRSPARAIADYFVGAWRELRQVRWPNRLQTWQMTGALVGFTAFFLIIILLLDAGFKYLFNVLLGH